MLTKGVCKTRKTNSCPIYVAAGFLFPDFVSIAYLPGPFSAGTLGVVDKQAIFGQVVTLNDNEDTEPK